MISAMNNSNKSEVVDDQMFMFSQMYPGGVVYAPLDHHTSVQQAQPGDKKTKRRRRKKIKASDGADGSETALRKRKLTEEQVNMLELNFGNEHKLECERKDRLAAELGLDPRQVAVWFQNRRARWKTKKLDVEYSKLKAAHDSLVLRNCQLESQVMKLEERLAGSESEVRRLTEKCSEVTTSSNSPMSCLSMEAMDAPFIGGFGMIEEDLQNVFYLPEDNYAPGYIEWANLYM